MKLWIKLTSLALSALLLAGMLIACSKGMGDKETDGGDGSGNSYTLTVWGAQEDQAMLKRMCEAYAKANPQNTYTFRYGVQGEGDVGDKLLADVMAGPDVFSFPSDRINSFYAAGALARIGGDLEKTVKAQNTKGSVEAASVTVGGEEQLYAFPSTGDNCYFLYYDKSVYKNASDVDSLDSLLSVAAAAGKKVHFKINDDGWYLSSFFFADDDLGYNVTYNDRMVEEKVTINFDSEDGLDVMRAINRYLSSDALVAQTDDSKMIAALTPDKNGKREAAAVVSGTWNAPAIKELLGDNMGVAVLPTVTIDGETERLSGFMGYKLIGVNGYSKNKGEASRLAAFLTNEENQLLRYETRGFAPTNEKVAAREEIKQDPVISTVLKQATYNRSQKNVPNAYWTPMGSLITPLITARAEGRTVSDSEMQGYLNALCQQIRKG